MCEVFYLRVCTWACLVPENVRRGYGFSGAAFMGSSEPPHGCWESNLGPLPQLQEEFLTAEASLRPGLLSLLLGTRA